jgi:hypothetical protein
VALDGRCQIHLPSGGAITCGSGDCRHEGSELVCRG